MRNQDWTGNAGLVQILGITAHPLRNILMIAVEDLLPWIWWPPKECDHGVCIEPLVVLIDTMTIESNHLPFVRATAESDLTEF